MKQIKIDLNTKNFGFFNCSYFKQHLICTEYCTQWRSGEGQVGEHAPRHTIKLVIVLLVRVSNSFAKFILSPTKNLFTLIFNNRFMHLFRYCSLQKIRMQVKSKCCPVFVMTSQKFVGSCEC